MRPILLAFAAAAVMAVGADLILDRAGFSAAERGTSSGAVGLD
jgi:hypothetical protein